MQEAPLIAWYGDDFTGGASVMEVLSFAGVPTLIFLDVPTEEQLQRHPDLRAIGIASTARAQSPEWMSEHLPAAFAALQALNPSLLHYKTCSTLDSSPTIGSIGRAIEIGADLLEPETVPFLVAAPDMRRYQLFGHLFAGLGDDVYRLDRHPVMARHPITPMTESDVGLHLAQQSDRLDFSVWTLEDIAAGNAPEVTKNNGRISVCTLDCVDAKTEAACGAYLWENRDKNRFVAGSQGIEYALVRHWIETGVLAPQSPPGSVGRSKGMVTVSGSVSPTTAEQIAWSRANGFETIRFDTVQTCADAATLEREKERVISASLAALAKGVDPLIFTAEGPDERSVDQLRQAVAASNKDMAQVNQTIGTALGDILLRILTESGIRRAIVSGGDTSGYATGQLGIYALSALAPTTPGAALFKAHAEGPMDGLELALKGGQMGSPDYFGWIREGGGLR